jgi:hypothetical protein
MQHHCRMTHALPIAAIAALFTLGNFSLAEAKPMALPGSNWTLDLPDGYSIQQKVLPSFVNASGTTIILFDAPPQPLKGLTVPKVGEVSDVGTDNEAKLETVEELRIDGHEAWFLRQRFEKQKTTGLTLLVEGKASNANIVSRLTDDQMKALKVEDVRELLLTLREKILTEQERLSALPFEIKDSNGFTLAGVVGNSIAVFTDGPEKSVEKAPKQATVSVILSPPGPQAISPEMLAIFDKQGMLEGLLTHQLIGAVPGAHKPILMNDIPTLQIPYTRASRDGSVKLQGEMRFLGADKQLLMIYSSYPEGDTDKAAATLKLIESVAMKTMAQ